MSEQQDDENPYGVKPGQIWQSCDKRDDYRRVTVESVDDGYAYVRWLKVTRVKLTRFRPNSRGYKLIRDVP
jgi:hypothetical protein